MKKIAFEFAVRPDTVQADRKSMNIATLDARGV